VRTQCTVRRNPNAQLAGGSLSRTSTALPAPPDHCPHGGIRLGDTLVCARCTAENEDVLFGLAVLYVARKAARYTKISMSTFQDDVGTAAAAIVQYKNKILTAENPTGMAITIAKRAIRKSYRSTSVPSSAVGTWDFKGHGEEGTGTGTASGSGGVGHENATLTQRLETMQAMFLPLEFEDSKTIPEYGSTALLNPANEDKIYRSSEERAYNRMREFPGIHLLWNDQNFNRLCDAIADFADQNPDVWNVIDLRIAFTRSLDEIQENGEENATEVKGLSWPKIAKKLNINERQARYKYTQGCRLLRDYILKTLLP
jgi:hypothetical protein